MILVHTSVCIRFLANIRPFASQMRELLMLQQVTGHEFVYGELLIGDLGGRRQALADYSLMFQVPRLAHTEVVDFVRFHRLSGRGLSWIDTHLLAAALVSRNQLWTADTRLNQAAHDLGVAYTHTVQ